VKGSSSIARAVSLLAGAAILGAAGAASAGASSYGTLTIYAVPTAAHFMDHADDRQRGIGNNPFNVDTKTLEPLTKKKEEAAGGPFPGDQATYQFKLFGNASLKKSIGTATIYCTYNFNQNAECNALFTMKGGTLFAEGPIDFNAKTFNLAVTGGTAKYIGAGGQVSAAPAKKSQRFDFQFG
jgi:hypothetical protein